MHRFFCLIPYSLKNYLKKFENFLSTGSTGWEPAQPVQWISIEVHYSSMFKFGAPELVLVISTSSRLEIMHHFFFFLDSLLFKEHSVKFSNFFSTVLTSWELVHSDHYANLYKALILVILEPKSYMVQSHKLQISPRHGLGPVLSYFVGFLQPTLSPFGFLVVKKMDKCGQLLTS